MSFQEEDLDSLVLRWLEGTSTPSEGARLQELLLKNQNFRAEFCDWIKRLRNPNWNRGEGQAA